MRLIPLLLLASCVSLKPAPILEPVQAPVVRADPIIVELTHDIPQDNSLKETPESEEETPPARSLVVPPPAVIDVPESNDGDRFAVVAVSLIVLIVTLGATWVLVRRKSLDTRDPRA